MRIRLVLVLMAFAGACEQTAAPEAPSDDAQAVIPDGAEQPSLASMLTSEEATALAEAYLHGSIPHFLYLLSERRGEPIHLPGLTLSHVAYAPSPYPSEQLPMPVRNRWGPQYLAYYSEQDGDIALILAIAAHATNLRLADGRIVWPTRYGHEFYTVAVPKSLNGDVVTTAPQAASRVSASIDVPIASVTGPYRLPPPAAPQSSVWKVTLEEAADVVTPSGATVSARDLFVAPDGTVLRAKEEQPATLQVRYRDSGASTRRTEMVPRLPAHPVLFERVLKN